MFLLRSSPARPRSCPGCAAAATEPLLPHPCVWLLEHPWLLGSVHVALSLFLRPIPNLLWRSLNANPTAASSLPSCQSCELLISLDS